MRNWILRRPEKVLFWAFLGMVILIGGCCGPGGQRPLRPWFPPCDSAHCGGGCWEEGGCGIGSAGMGDRQTEADLACQGCLPTPQPAGCYPGPLSWLFTRVFWPYTPGFAGCGERYWSPWAADPPDCCEPCDHYGQWIGAQRGTGYSSMYPGAFPGPIYSEAPVMEPESASSNVPASVPRQPPRPGCSECGKGHQVRLDRIPSPPRNNQQSFMDPRVSPTGYSNLAQRPRQPYRDPAAR